MKTIPPAMATFFANNNKMLVADLYEITLRQGSVGLDLGRGINANVLRWTTWETDIAGYSSLGPTLARSSTSQASRGEIGSLKVILGAGAFILPDGRSLPKAANDGVFDGAGVVISKLPMDVASPGDVSLGTLKWFEGDVAKVEATSYEVSLEVKDAKEKLNLQMPRHVFRPQCNHSLYDKGCGVIQASWTLNGVVSLAGSTDTVLKSNLAAQGAYAANRYQYGTVKFTSGLLKGAIRPVLSNVASGDITLGVAFPLPPQVGDTFSISLGCNKAFRNGDGTQGDCGAKFLNEARFRGYPYVPKPESAR